MARRIQLTGDTCSIVVILDLVGKREFVLLAERMLKKLFPEREEEKWVIISGEGGREMGKYVLGQCQFGQSLSCSI